MWIVGTILIGFACFAVVIGLFQFSGAPAGPSREPALARNPEPEPAPEPAPGPPAEPSTSKLEKVREVAATGLSTTATAPLPASPSRLPRKPPPVKWEEPQDSEPAPEGVADASARGEGAANLPDWARAPVPERIPGPLAAVRRVAEPGESAPFPSLHEALERTLGGTVELTDEGPLYEGDLHLSGESRLIRARPGCRPIVKLEGSSREAAREQRAVFVLDRKNLVLDGIDFVVRVPDLSSNQTALFSCAGASLTIRNCTFTILNPSNASCALVRADSPVGHHTRIRLEKTLVRGWLTSGIEIAGAATDLVLDRSAILADGGPLVRVTDGPSAGETRLYFVDSVLAGPGPIIERRPADATTRPRPLKIAIHDSALGRFHGVGIASVIASAYSVPPAETQIAWSGDHNVFAGWKGFFAGGTDATITVSTLAEVRSTWGASEQGSQHFTVPWPEPWELAAATAAELSSSLPGRQGVLRQIAQPRAGLFEKTVARYPLPMIPEPVRRPTDEASVRDGMARGFRMIVKPGLKKLQVPTVPASPISASPRQIDSSGALELTFNTQSPPWNGDLGTFLRDQIDDSVPRAHVRVVGSGSHLSTPVRLPRGLMLEIRVTPLADAEPPSWTPRPELSGQGLIELEGGALVLERVVLRHDPGSRLEHLLHVENGHLVLARCQLIAPAAGTGFRGDLIAFRAASTQPMSNDPEEPVFSTPADRPVCRLDDSLLITGGTALHAELGRGLVALSQCAIASGETAIELVPAKVSRARFEADLCLEHCTLASEQAIVRMGAWPGLPPGPDRPWLITTKNCAYLATYDRKSRATALLRSDAEALAHGAVFWQGTDDAAEVDFFAVVGDGPAPLNRSRDVQLQWVRFWGGTHMRGITGPRGPSSVPAVRLLARLRPGHVEPVDLILDPDYPHDKAELAVGADLRRQGITARTGRVGRQRN
jgi:serine/threonine-protein kinase